jgi:hypothetical protein
VGKWVIPKFLNYTRKIYRKENGTEWKGEIRWRLRNMLAKMFLAPNKIWEIVASATF